MVLGGPLLSSAGVDIVVRHGVGRLQLLVVTLEVQRAVCPRVLSPRLGLAPPFLAFRALVFIKLICIVPAAIDVNALKKPAIIGFSILLLKLNSVRFVIWRFLGTRL